MIVLASTMSGCTSLKRDAPLSEPCLSKATRADLGRMMAARGLSCSSLTVDQMNVMLRQADQSFAQRRAGPQMQRMLCQAPQEYTERFQRPCRQMCSLAKATRAILENKMAALDLCSHGPTKVQMREKIYQTDPTLNPEYGARGRTALSRLTKSQLLLEAAGGHHVLEFGERSSADTTFSTRCTLTLGPTPAIRKTRVCPA